MITITINDKEITLDQPMSVLEASRQAGIKIPTLCNHEILKPYGGCRLCVVEVERMPRLQNSCTLIAADGMVVKTESDVISEVRRGILEFLLINHPLDCPYCDKAGECELQDLVNKYGATAGRYKEEKRKVPESRKDQIFARNMERCVACTRCVRMCHDVQGSSSIAMIGRGGHTRMEPFTAESFNCEYCGNCLTVCPVGAILSRLNMHSFRPWQVDKEVETVCSYCGVGCSLIAQVRDDSIKRVIPKLGLGVNKGLLCSRGRFGYEYIGSEERLKTPLVKKDGELVQSTWSEALGIVADKLTEISKVNSGSSIAGIASSRCSNEDNYVFQKFMRMACGTNNIDSVSRTGFAAAQKYFEDLLGQGITGNMVDGLKHSETILVLGGDPTNVNPVLGLSIRQAARDGANIVVIGNAGGLEKFKTVQVVPHVFEEAEVLESLLLAVSKEKGVRGERPFVDKELRVLADRAPKTDVEGFEEAKKALLESGSTSIVMGMDLVQRTDGHRLLFTVAGLTYLLEARLYLLCERPNEQGLIDAGCVPEMLPGGRPINISDFRAKFEAEWNGTLPENDGLTILEMIEGARNHTIKAMYVMGENPAFNLPDSQSVKDALSGLDFLVVQDIFLTETAEMADVVLPALGWTEKAGTYTNLERRIQLQKKVVEQTGGMEDWRIIAELSNKMGYAMNYSETEDIMREIARVSPLYRDLSYNEIAQGNCLWPYHGEPLRGEVNEVPGMHDVDKEYNADFYLAVEKPLFHSGTLSRRSEALMKIYPEPLLKVGGSTAAKIGLQDGDRVQFTTSSGTIEALVAIDDSIKDNRVYYSNNFRSGGVFSVMKFNIDKVTNAPGIEGCEVRIKKL
ncbi:MAG TPA: NADH dehydrogenase (quinone) subunit G [Nitrospirae bacterium]|nr:putative formate dehydrogenase [bacterium BMS3Abin09]GBE40873.1 putative formate dehydrogenase [bacterium BMS3Bbin09]HDH33992.1 NADH dehydrogenase (quinone) subunit G [Nitrospirota bacterium]HDN95136.1 NADH dehydrogenase (quinone) subunit G [Nitrospirota bacterium]HDO66716.1 NADH dehydrogenase (quinone) subunit G [Nitrospirota bacterium]